MLITETPFYLSINYLMDSGWCKCNGGKQTKLVNENYGKQSWTRREATAHEPQRRKNDDAKN